MDATNTTTSATEASDDGVAVAIIICIHTIGWMNACVQHCNTSMNAWMNGWPAEQMDGWMDVWMSG